jgi:hypothetical protein
VAVDPPYTGGYRGEIHDYGEISPALAAKGIGAAGWIRPGGQISFRMTLGTEANYVLWCAYTGDHVALIVNGPAGRAELSPQGGGQFHDYHFKLEAGTYTITALADGSDRVYIDWDLLLDNGVGQSEAVRLVSVPVNDEIAPLPVSSTSTLSQSPGSPNTGPPSPLPFSTGLSLIPEGTPLGMPTSTTDQFSVVGPVVEEGSVALADAGMELGLASYTSTARAKTESSTPPPAEMRSAEDFLASETDGAALASTAWIDWLATLVRGGILGENPRPADELIPVEAASTSRPIEELGESRFDRIDLPSSLEEGMGVAWIIPVALLATRTRRIFKISALHPKTPKTTRTPPPCFERRIRTHPTGPVRHRGWLQGTRKGARPRSTV